MRGALAILAVEDVSISFGGLKALSNVRLESYPGLILSVIGPNGSGKTTLINVCTGFYVPNSGSILWESKDIRGMKPYKLARLGIARTFQQVKAFEKLTVLENVVTGAYCKGKTGIMGCSLSLPKSRRESKRLYLEAQETLRLFGLEADAFEYPQNLPFGKRKLMEIARAQASEPRILFLDEPAAGLNRQETVILSEIIRKISDTGVSIVLIEHVMELVMEISDNIIVLNHGIKIAEGNPEEVQYDQAVISAYLGE